MAITYLAVGRHANQKRKVLLPRKGGLAIQKNSSIAVNSNTDFTPETVRLCCISIRRTKSNLPSMLDSALLTSESLTDAWQDPMTPRSCERFDFRELSLSAQGFIVSPISDAANCAIGSSPRRAVARQVKKQDSLQDSGEGSRNLQSLASTLGSPRKRLQQKVEKISQADGSSIQPCQRISKRYMLRFFEESRPDLPWLELFQCMLLVMSGKMAFLTAEEKAVFEARLLTAKEAWRMTSADGGAFTSLEAALWSHPTIVSLVARLQKTSAAVAGPNAFKSMIFAGRRGLASGRDGTGISLSSASPVGGGCLENLRRAGDLGGPFNLSTGPFKAISLPSVSHPILPAKLPNDGGIPAQQAAVLGATIAPKLALPDGLASRPSAAAFGDCAVLRSTAKSIKGMPGPLPQTAEEVGRLAMACNVLETVIGADKTASERCPVGWGTGYRTEAMSGEEIKRAIVMERFSRISAGGKTRNATRFGSRSAR